MKICGIDASTKKTGIALLEDGKLIDYRLLDYSREYLEKRMRNMLADIHSVLSYYEPDFIRCEDVWIDKNADTAKILARLGGGIYMWAVINNTNFAYIIPSHWRKIVGLPGKGNRTELKKLAIKKVKSDYGLDVTDDIAEAILIGASGFIEQENLFE